MCRQQTGGSIPQALAPPEAHVPQALAPPEADVPQELAPPEADVPQALSPPKSRCSTCMLHGARRSQTMFYCYAVMPHQEACVPHALCSEKPQSVCCTTIASTHRLRISEHILYLTSYVLYFLLTSYVLRRVLRPTCSQPPSLAGVGSICRWTGIPKP